MAGGEEVDEGALEGVEERADEVQGGDEGVEAQHQGPEDRPGEVEAGVAARPVDYAGVLGPLGARVVAAGKGRIR